MGENHTIAHNLWHSEEGCLKSGCAAGHQCRHGMTEQGIGLAIDYAHSGAVEETAPEGSGAGEASGEPEKE